MLVGSGSGVSVGSGSGVSVGSGSGVSVGSGSGVSVGLGTAVLVGCGRGVSVGLGTAVLLGCGRGVEVGGADVLVALGTSVAVGLAAVGEGRVVAVGTRTPMLVGLACGSGVDLPGAVRVAVGDELLPPGTPGALSPASVGAAGVLVAVSWAGWAAPLAVGVAVGSG